MCKPRFCISKNSGLPIVSVMAFSPPVRQRTVSGCMYLLSSIQHVCTGVLCKWHKACFAHFRAARQSIVTAVVNAVLIHIYVIAIHTDFPRTPSHVSHLIKLPVNRKIVLDFREIAATDLN